MRVSVTEAEGRLAELVRRAEDGDEIVLTRHGRAKVRLVPVDAVPLRAVPDRQSRRALLEAVRASAAGKVTVGPTAVRSQDFLYGDGVRSDNYHRRIS